MSYSKKLFSGILAGIFIGVFFSYFLLSSVAVLDSSSSSVPIKYKAQVCVYKTAWLGDHYGDREVVDCSHNVLYNTGQNMTRDLLGGGGNFIRNISLCNATALNCTAPVAAGTETFTTYLGCGLNSTQGTYTPLATVAGNWSVYTTFTATCNNLEMNATRLLNATGSLFAGNSFAFVTLQTNDQLTVNWTIGVA